MTREQFCALPLSVALGIIHDCIKMESFGPIEMAPEYRAPMAPKFDQKLRTKGGYMWASECSLRELEYQHGFLTRPGKPEYAEKNAKAAKGVSFWLEWRRAFPSEVWSGERNRVQCTAAPPRGKPQVHPWEDRDAPAPAQSTPLPSFSDDEGGGDDSYPF